MKNIVTFFQHRLFSKAIMLLVLVGFAVGISSCYRDYGLTTVDYDAVLTLYDKEYNFKKNKTYYLPDSVVYLRDTTEESTERPFEKQILDQIQTNMTSAGYDLIEYDPDVTPDVFVFAVAFETEHEYSYWYPGYPWYPGWGYPGYGWGYPGWGYPGYGGTTKFKTGTVAIFMLDADEIEDNIDTQLQELPPADWGCALNGLLSSKVVSNEKRIRDMIDQGFSQSPYLKLFQPDGSPILNGGK
jgi:uncharacterized protein DUF4136